MPAILADDVRILGLSALNVLAVYRRATVEQLATGLSWYRDAQSIATRLAKGNTAQGAGVLAALSPQKSWGENVNLAARAFTDGRATGHVSNACSKADRILAGEHWSDVLPIAKKTGLFARCIESGGRDPFAVCVDRHAFDVAVGEVTDDWSRKVLDRKGGYEAVAAVYVEAASCLAGEGVWVTPAEVQAVTWVVWRAEKGLVD